MQNYFSKTIIDLEDQLLFINAEFDNRQKCAEESFKIISIAYDKLQVFLLKYKFKTEQEEIRYFKSQKPKLISKLIYFGKVYHIEMKKPQGTDKSKKKYLLNELDKINRYFDNNIDFIRYYRSNDTYLDYKYFVRNKIDFRHSHESFSIELDRKQSTSFDFKISKIMANDLLQIYLHDELNFLELYDKKDKSQVVHKSNLTWTAPKVHLIEILYAFHSAGVFNNGKAELKEIASHLESSFGLDFGQYHRTFLEIRVRKTGRTKFLDDLKSSLNKRMNEADDNP